ncbi:hypothetical protein QVD17_19180 [Tagetes erecta]|uniref:F-box domain-containing protein n=1 Tax=Tagetes erecta TaxID=13708 RepID=A0AAD8NX30_TARER|nr:hypothetical protein QVD17_19180 [Tagetes erecta]
MKSQALNIPFDVLEKIMEFCVGIEYLNFRATCKQWHLAAPIIRWSKGERLQSYSLASPWLMVVHENRGAISFTDLICGDIYYIKTPQQLLGRLEIHCSVGGWLLIRRVEGPLMFFNPFTGDIRELPFVPYLHSYCFSAPPTSPDCKVVGFTTFLEWKVYIHFVAIEPYWFRFHLNNFFGDDSQPFRFATYCQIYMYCIPMKELVSYVETTKKITLGTTSQEIPAHLPNKTS